MDVGEFKSRVKSPTRKTDVWGTPWEPLILATRPVSTGLRVLIPVKCRSIFTNVAGLLEKRPAFLWIIESPEVRNSCFAIYVTCLSGHPLRGFRLRVPDRKAYALYNY
jgi:hypothetical protein